MGMDTLDFERDDGALARSITKNTQGIDFPELFVCVLTQIRFVRGYVFPAYAFHIVECSTQSQ